MAKNTLPKIAPINYATAKTEQTFIDFVVKNNSSTHYNLHGNLANLPMGLQIIIKDINSKHTFSSTDTATLGTFTATIDNFLSCNDRIGNFFTPTSIDLPSLFNEMMAWNNYLSFKKALKLPLKREQKNALVSLFSIVKHCQDPDNYPIGYPFWKNISSHYFSQKRDYDVLCGFYKKTIPSTDTPKHLHFAAYMHQLAINLANALAPNINSYTNDDIKSIFNIPDYDAVMGFLRSKTKKVPTPTPTTTPNSTLTPTTFSSDSDSSHPLNLILYGPPGTGKTYNTVNKALDIVEPNWRKDFEDQKSSSGGEKDERKYAQQRFDYYKDTTGQIVFTTFHQSMSYEDFIEGIKPIPPQNNEEQMVYDVQDGLFKQICEKAKKISVVNTSTKIDFSKTRVFKMSLGEKGKDADSVFEYCVENEVLALGWGDSKDFSTCKTRADFKKLDPTWGAAALEIFKEWMKPGDIVLISDGIKEVKGVAQVDGDYEFRDDPSIDMHQFRKAKWLYTGDNIPISKLYDKNLSQQSIYGFYKEKKGVVDNGGIKIDVLNEIITGEINDKKEENYVLIIDEINRGNVAQIFGELITLIEPSKRLGNDEEMKAILPYSSVQKGKPVYFGVPNNLYIIGTMNTADRSVEALDTALRRRFSFEEMMPKAELLGDTEVCGVKLSKLLKTINDRIVALKDREHQIGHSYFMGCPDDEAKANTWLTGIFKDKIIPLLQEYFYGDYKKIYYVLGPGFVEKKTGKTIFAVDVTNDGFDFDIPEEKYEIRTESFDIQQAIKDLKVQF